jgi:hypothetical protein
VAPLPHAASIAASSPHPIGRRADTADGVAPRGHVIGPAP